MESSPSDPRPLAAPLLDYAPGGVGEMVLLARFASPEEAGLHAATLAAEGISTQILNANVNTLGAFAVGLADVGLYVHADDSARAGEVLKIASSEALEPAPEGGLAEPAFDERGQPIALADLSAFQTVREMRDAQTLLASAGILSYLPKLVPRGNRPAGVGNRFVLSVAVEDVERARLQLQQAEQDTDEELPRCPRCGSWRVYPVTHFLQSLAAMVGLAAKPAEEFECLSCRHHGVKAEFNRSA